MHGAGALFLFRFRDRGRGISGGQAAPLELAGRHAHLLFEGLAEGLQGFVVQHVGDFGEGPAVVQDQLLALVDLHLQNVPLQRHAGLLLEHMGDVGVAEVHLLGQGADVRNGEDVVLDVFDESVHRGAHHPGVGCVRSRLGAQVVLGKGAPGEDHDVFQAVAQIFKGVGQLLVELRQHVFQHPAHPVMVAGALVGAQ